MATIPRVAYIPGYTPPAIPRRLSSRQEPLLGTEVYIPRVVQGVHTQGSTYPAW